ncbi:MAG TPA: hypothetical protein VHM70_02120 [Polyangiaceae bacterium]|jgi:hypothetical protein|nr:hypothetical protein [Polyangiaceae bacterium]
MSSLGSHNPANGGRVDLHLQDITATHVTYTVALATATNRWQGVVALAIDDGSLAWQGGQGETAPDWLIEFCRGLLRSAWRTRESVAWPRRLTRWRDAKD